MLSHHEELWDWGARIALIFFFFGLATDFTEKEGVLVVYLSVC